MFLRHRIRPPGCKVDIKEIAARWQELSFLLQPFLVLLIYLRLKQNSPWKNKVTGLLSKNNRCSGCFCLQNLCNILMSKESVSDRGEFRCLSEENCPYNTAYLIRHAEARLFQYLPLAGVHSTKEFWSSAFGLPDAGLILKKMPLVGKSFLFFSNHSSFCLFTFS